MAINFSQQVYKPSFDTFGRLVTFDPIVSQSGGPAYVGRGIPSLQPLDVAAEDGSIYSDTEVILDILEEEFAVMPIQGDEVTIVADSGMPSWGTFVVIDTKPNGGGERTLLLREKVASKP